MFCKFEIPFKPDQKLKEHNDPYMNIQKFMTNKKHDEKQSQKERR